ncbi:fibrous sheath CABYR-binding protein-like [Ctenocephalides felis]|uniref:fibrous sheath CABYR-binding protein-like n=1 Tax=Ctenocephalides felis TaxID=7515 RepID=UPI000E6E31E0|nr:fibrous sheath CABYR-binding protein-like [Ctenocephalides felis]
MDKKVNGADENAAAVAPAGDVPAAASPKEEITKDETSAPQSEVIKSEEAPAPKVTESTAEKTNEAVKTPVEDKCEKPVAPIACEAACEKPATCESKEVKDPVPAEPVQTLEAAPAAEPVEHVTSAAENKVEEPAKTDVVAEVPVPENVEAKQDRNLYLLHQLRNRKRFVIIHHHPHYQFPHPLPK